MGTVGPCDLEVPRQTEIVRESRVRDNKTTSYYSIQWDSKLPAKHGICASSNKTGTRQTPVFSLV